MVGNQWVSYSCNLRVRRENPRRPKWEKSVLTCTDRASPRWSLGLDAKMARAAEPEMGLIGFDDAVVCSEIQRNSQLWEKEKVDKEAGLVQPGRIESW